MRSCTIVLSVVACLGNFPSYGAAQDPAKSPRLDQHGDPLPPGALARLGTTRLRHSGQIACLAFSPDGKILASGGWEGPLAFRGLTLSRHAETGVSTVHLWDVVTGRRLRRLGSHDVLVRCLVFSPDGKTLASSGEEAEVRVWDVATGRRLHSFFTPTAPTALAFSSDGKRLAATTAVNAAYLWDVATGQEVRQFSLANARLCNMTSLVFAPDDRMLAVGAYQPHGVLVWETETGTLRHQLLRGTSSPILSVAFAPDGKTLVSGDRDEAIRCWDVDTGKQRYLAVSQNGAVHRVCIAPDGKTLASSGDSGVILWDAATGQQRFQIGGAGERNRAIAFAPDGKTLAWSTGQSIQRIDVRTRQQLNQTPGPLETVEWVAFAPNGRMVLTTNERRLYLWDETGKERPFNGPPVRVGCAAFSPDGQALLLGGLDETLRLCDVDSGKELRRFTGEPGQVEFVLVFPDGKTALSMSRRKQLRREGMAVVLVDDHIRRWDVDSGKQKTAFKPHTIYRLAVTPDARWLFTGYDLIDLRFDRTWGKLESQLLPAYCVAVSPDGRRLAIGSARGTLGIFDALTGQELYRRGEHDTLLLALAFSPDGRLLAGGGADRNVRLWDVESGKELKSLTGHDGMVMALAFAPDGKRLLSGSSDTTALLWDLRDAAPLPPPAKKLDEVELKVLWKHLASPKAAYAWEARGELLQAPGQAVPFLREQLRASPGVTAKQIEQLIADLNDTRFAVREKAMKELGQLGRVAELPLRQTYQKPPTEEVRRRIARLLEQVETAKLPPDLVRRLRCVDLLERLGTAEAREVLVELVRGTVEPMVVDEAQAALERLKMA